MSKLFTYGMTLDQAIACVTIKAARTFAFLNDRGALHVGAITDLALLETTGGKSLIPRQLQEHHHRPPEALPHCHRARRQAGPARVAGRSVFQYILLSTFPFRERG
jgi:predicted amidohydrolase YtcJ